MKGLSILYVVSSIHISVYINVCLSITVVNFEYMTSLHQCFSLYCNYTKSELIGILIFY